jgi:hypothetical protein
MHAVFASKRDKRTIYKAKKLVELMKVPKFLACRISSGTHEGVETLFMPNLPQKGARGPFTKFYKACKATATHIDIGIFK